MVKRNRKESSPREEARAMIEIEGIRQAWHEYAQAAKDGSAEDLVEALRFAREAREDALIDARLAYDRAVEAPRTLYYERTVRAEQARSQALESVAEIQRDGSYRPAEIQDAIVDVEMAYTNRLDAADAEMHAVVEPAQRIFVDAVRTIRETYNTEALEARRLVHDNHWFDWVPEGSPERKLIEAAVS